MLTGVICECACHIIIHTCLCMHNGRSAEANSLHIKHGLSSPLSSLEATVRAPLKVHAAEHYIATGKNTSLLILSMLNHIERKFICLAD